MRNSNGWNIRQLFTEMTKAQTLAISLLSAIFVIIIYYLISRSFEFQNNVEIKDIVTLFFNALFVLIISQSLTKTYDSDRKEKDIYINELQFFLDKINKFYLELKDSNYSRQNAFNSITELRDEAASITSLINGKFKVDVSPNILKIQGMLRTTDKIINPAEGFPDTINNEQATLINSQKIKIREAILSVISMVNNA